MKNGAAKPCPGEKPMRPVAQYVAVQPEEYHALEPPRATARNDRTPEFAPGGVTSLVLAMVVMGSELPIAIA